MFKSPIVKKVTILLLMLVLLVNLCACSNTNGVINSLPAYKEKAFYTSGGAQDYTDYAKYTFESITAKDAQKSAYFCAVTADDVEEVLAYIANFEQWVETVGKELKENYDFDKSVVSEGDFFYIKTKHGEPLGEGTYGKFDNYTLYYIDLDTRILYYFHNNI